MGQNGRHNTSRMSRQQPIHSYHNDNNNFHNVCIISHDISILSDWILILAAWNDKQYVQQPIDLYNWQHLFRVGE